MANLDFFLGQKIICVDDSIHKEWLDPRIHYIGGLRGLRYGEIYTVQKFMMDSDYAKNRWGFGSIPYEDYLIIWINEIPNDPAGFHHSRFRPLEEKPFESKWVTKFVKNLEKDRLLEVSP